MEIQQQQKESPAAYIHRFKTEAKGCNFTNDATTIRIFIKGLKNAHSFTTCIYEKGPHMLTDAISEAEKLNAIQQLTAMIIPPSTVNVMSLFLVPGTKTYSMKLPSYYLLWVWWIWSHCHGLSTQDTSFRSPSDSSHTFQKLPCQISFKTPLWRKRQAKLIQITI